MDGNGSLNMRNWGFYDQTTTLKGHLGLQLMPTLTEKPLMSGRHHPEHHHHPSMMGAAAAAAAAAANGSAYHHPHHISEPLMPMDYMRDSWISQRDREKYQNMLPGNHHHSSSYGALTETPTTHHPLQILQQPSLSKHETVPQMEETSVERDVGGPLKKRSEGKSQKSPKAKKAKRAPRAPMDDSGSSIQRTRTPKKSVEVVINGLDLDISGIPIPVCSCTGNPQQCYRWGSGGWQSACCTTAMSMYPLPMSTKRRGARIAGRKMSLGAFKKVLEKLASEGYNFSNPIDLKAHWAKHGTNKFVTIR